MKIYKEIRISMETGEVISEDSFDYSGPISECKGGGSTTTNSSTTTVDPVYNAGMLELSQEQQDWARELYNMSVYGVPGGKADPNYDPANVTSEMQYLQNVISANQSLIGLQTEAEAANIKAMMEGSRTQEAVASAEGEMIDSRYDLELANIGLTQDQISQAKALIPEQTNLSLADINSKLQQIGLTNEQIQSARNILPMQEAVESTQLETQLKQLGLTDAQTASALQLLPQQTQLSSEEMNSRLAQLGLTNAQTASALQLLPQQTALTEAQISSERALTPIRTEAERALTPIRTEAETANLTDSMRRIEERAPVRSKMYQEAMNGLDIGGRMNQAQADVEHGFKTAADSRTRELQSYGLNPGDAKYQSMVRAGELEKAKAIAGKRTLARDDAEKEQFARLTTAMTL